MREYFFNNESSLQFHKLKLAVLLRRFPIVKYCAIKETYWEGTFCLCKSGFEIL